MRSARTLAIWLLMMVAVFPCAGQRTQGRLPLEIRIDLGQKRFITKESMVLRISIRNTGSSPIEVPNPENNRNSQPVYTITGPSYPKGHLFHFRSVALGDTRPATQMEPGMMIKLAPGSTHEAALPLEQLVRFSQPGPHTLSASIEAGGLRAESADLEFVIEPATIRSMQFLGDDGAQGSNPIRVLCLIGDRLYQAILHEDRPDLGEVTLAKMIHVATTDAAASTVVGPWANHERLESLLNRFAWHGGTLLGVDGLADTKSLRFTMPSTPKQVIRPALMPDSGEVDVLTLSADAKAVSLVRFPLPREGAEAKLLWTTPLPGVANGSRAAIAPRAAKARRVAVFVTPDSSGGSKMVLVETLPGDAKPVIREVSVQNAVPLPESEPGIQVGADGTIRAAALFVEDQRARKIIVADVKWPQGSGEGVVTRATAGRLPAAARSAQVTYSVSPKSNGRRDWLVLLQDGAVVFSGSPGRPRKVDGTPSLPLDLVSMSHMTYLLTLDKQGLPRLELMH